MPTYNPIGRASFSTTPFAYTPLLSDGDDVVSRSGTVASGIGVLTRGTILKIDPATGNITVPVAAADCNCILVNDIDATSTTVAATVYVSGKVKADALVWPGALGHGVVTDALRDFGILVESVVYTDGTLIRSAESSPPPVLASVTLNPTSSPDLPNTSSAGHTFTVTSPSATPWTAVSSAPWLLIVSPAGPVTGDGTVSFSVTLNGTAADRQGTITVGDQTFAVKQLA